MRGAATETITMETNQLLASLGISANTATIAHALPPATSIAMVMFCWTFSDIFCT